MVPGAAGVAFTFIASELAKGLIHPAVLMAFTYKVPEAAEDEAANVMELVELEPVNPVIGFCH